LRALKQYLSNQLINIQKSKIMTTHQREAVIPQITEDKLDNILSDTNFKIIDVRDAKGIEKQGSIPGAINIPLDLVEEEIGKRHQNPDSIFNHDGSFLFCCTGGVMSYMAAIRARENGIENVFNLEGGHSAWIKWKQAKHEVQITLQRLH
jgi:rhodanese-related sulfurtransferase